MNSNRWSFPSQFSPSPIVQIPYLELSSEALAAIVLEFVTRDGTDHSSIDKRMSTVMLQLENGDVELHFDPESETCNIIRV